MRLLPLVSTSSRRYRATISEIGRVPDSQRLTFARLVPIAAASCAGESPSRFRSRWNSPPVTGGCYLRKQPAVNEPSEHRGPDARVAADHHRRNVATTDGGGKPRFLDAEADGGHVQREQLFGGGRLGPPVRQQHGPEIGFEASGLPVGLRQLGPGQRGRQLGIQRQLGQRHGTVTVLYSATTDEAPIGSTTILDEPAPWDRHLRNSPPFPPDS